MREIKFRQLRGKHWHYWGYVDDDDTFSSPIHGDSQQYTGLKDKNGKEIYEGDIVKVNLRHRGVKDAVCQVHFHNSSFCALGEEFHDILHLITAREIEIIGNVWENPELVKGDK